MGFQGPNEPEFDGRGALRAATLEAYWGITPPSSACRVWRRIVAKHHLPQAAMIRRWSMQRFTPAAPKRS